MRRAEAVAETLVNDYAIERTRLKLTGQGFYQPRFSQPSEAAVSANRRVDIRVLQAQEVAGN
jgi:adhesin transport system outer membrane protein